MFGPTLTALGCPTVCCLPVRSAMARPPPPSRRYEEEDARHSPAVVGHNARMAPQFPLDCGKQRFTPGSIGSPFAVETELRANSRHAVLLWSRFMYRKYEIFPLNLLSKLCTGTCRMEFGFVWYCASMSQNFRYALLKILLVLQM
jgi:hypothetical protein